jgi:hypothetical protein
MESPNQFSDPAEPILRGDPQLTDDDRASLWDAFHSKSAAELEQHLMPLAMPEDTKKRLWDAKKAVTPVPAPVDNVTSIMQKMTTIDPQIMAVAEAHPVVFKTLVAAATPQPEPVGGTPAAGKGKPAGKAQKPAPLVQGPRPDGLEHMPPIPDGHHRVRASDGGIWDVPAEELDHARSVDPNLHVLNP